MEQKKSFSFLKLLYRLLFVGVIILGVAFLYLKFDTFLNYQKKARLDDKLQTQQQELQQYTNYTGYTTLLSIRTLEAKKVKLPWSKHIKQIFTILQDLKEVSDGSNNTIILSDFEVGLDKIKLNGKVTTLKALYYNSPNGNFKSLFDRFQALDFIKNLEIKNYEKSDEKYFDFVLHANVMINDGK
ncbi:MAG: hypothetical protein CR971_01560 [candidate division SR1 bacterium]|nr:MAG: hypothetical protein CR971_01560 [candidate division SR1 bacterium]